MIVLFIFGIKSILVDKNIKIIFILIFAFFIWCAVTSFWSPYSAFTLKRSFYFLIVASGSLFIGFYLTKYKNNLLLNSFLILNALIILISLYSLITQTPENSWSGGHGLGFMGFTNHQNKLGQYIYLSVAPIILFIDKNDLNKKVRYLVIVLLLINLIFIALSVSRAAILALFLAWLIYYLMNFQIIKTLIFSFVFVAVIALTVVLTANFFNKKQITLVKHENSFGERRFQTIKDSWDSALKGGFFGLGYGTSDERFNNPLLGYYDKTSEGDIYRREKTISALAIIEEVGMIGLILFITIIFYPISLLLKKLFFNSEFRILNSSFQILSFSLAILISLNVYAQIESWWIGIGSAVLPIYFVFVGNVIKESKIINVNSNG
ncbi:MAG: O-antigen ligase family protein [Melioribacteraceae bacterium]